MLAILFPEKASQEPIKEEEEEEAIEPQSQSEHSKRKKYFFLATNQNKIPQPSNSLVNIPTILS